MPSHPEGQQPEEPNALARRKESSKRLLPLFVRAYRELPVYSTRRLVNLLGMLGASLLGMMFTAVVDSLIALNAPTVAVVMFGSAITGLILARSVERDLLAIRDPRRVIAEEYNDALEAIAKLKNATKKERRTLELEAFAVRTRELEALPASPLGARQANAALAQDEPPTPDTDD